MTEIAAQTSLEGALRLSISGPMTIYTANEIKAQLLNALKASSIIELDLDHVSEMDTAGFQLLVLAKLESQRKDKILRIVAHSPAVRDVIVFYNMDAFFGDPVIIPAEN